MAKGDEHKSNGGQIETTPKPAPPQSRKLPPWKVILHNDDVNDMLYVVESIQMLTTLGRHHASQLGNTEHIPFF